MKKSMQITLHAKTQSHRAMRKIEIRLKKRYSFIFLLSVGLLERKLYWPQPKNHWKHQRQVLFLGKGGENWLRAVQLLKYNFLSE